MLDLTSIREVARRLVQTGRLMVGIHDYGHYLQHMRERHPEAPPMSRAAFYRRCQDSRYHGAGGRCPC